jgi:hypothetical protein
VADAWLALRAFDRQTPAPVLHSADGLTDLSAVAKAARDVGVVVGFAVALRDRC